MARNNKPAVHMIVIKDNPISEYYSEISTKSWERFGFSVLHIEAVTPETLNDYRFLKELNFQIKAKGRGAPREFTPTEKAIWASHHKIWRIASMKKNLTILAEHDAILLEDFDLGRCTVQGRTCAGLSHCGYLSKHPEKGKRISAGACYIMDKEIGKYFRQCIPKKIETNSDNYIHQVITHNGVWLQHHVTQFYDPKIGTTIDHG